MMTKEKLTKQQAIVTGSIYGYGNSRIDSSKCAANRVKPNDQLTTAAARNSLPQPTPSGVPPQPPINTHS